MINTDLSVQKRWVARRSFNNSFTLTITSGGSAYNVSSYTFTANIRKIGASTNSLQLTEGSGITNGGATGIVTVQLSAANSELLTVGSYFWEINYTVSSLSYGLLHGTFDLLSEYNPESENNAVSISVNLAGTDVNVTATIAGSGGLQFQDEGSNLGDIYADTVDFVGAGVTATRTGDKVTVTIPGGSFSGLTATRVIVATGATSVGDYSTFTFDSSNNALTVNSIRVLATGTNGAKGHFVGYTAGNTNTLTVSDGFNTGFGYQVLDAIIDGANFFNSSYNSAFGYQSGTALTTGRNSSLFGYQSGAALTTSANSTLIGALSGRYLTTQTDNTYVGYNTGSGASNTGISNTFVGSSAGAVNTSGDQGTFLGYLAGATNTTGDFNVFIGTEAGETNTTGSYNVYSGHWAGLYVRGSTNTFIGGDVWAQTAVNPSSGDGNTGLGYRAGLTDIIANASTSGDNNTYIGKESGLGSTTQVSGSTALGYRAKVYTSLSMTFGSEIDADRVNYGFGGESYASGKGVAFFKNAVTNPSGNPTNGFILYSDGAVAKVLNGSGSAITIMGNPMTTAGDLILGGASGAATRLAIGTSGYVLTSNGTTASWAAAASGFADPMTTRGDIIIRDATNTTARLGIGNSGYVLTSDGTDISWAAAASGGWAVTGTTTLTGAAVIDATTTNTITFQFNGLTTGTSSAFLLANNTAATSGATVQNSPTLVMRGTAWTGAASQTVDFVQYVQPATAATPTGKWFLTSSINGGAKVNAIRVDSDGANIGIQFNNGGALLSGTTTGIFTLNGNGSLRYGGVGTINYNNGSTTGAGTTGLTLTTTSGLALIHTTGTSTEINIGSNFSPTSGTAAYNLILTNKTINQTGGANGVIRLFNISPTYTATGGDTFFIDYSPTVTSITGVHYCFRATSGSMLIGGTTLTTNAILDLQSTSRAFIPPRMTEAQRDAIGTPSIGMMVYNTDTNVLNFYNGGAWGAV